MKSTTTARDGLPLSVGNTPPAATRPRHTERGSAYGRRRGVEHAHGRRGAGADAVRVDAQALSGRDLWPLSELNNGMGSTPMHLQASCGLCEHFEKMQGSLLYLKTDASHRIGDRTYQSKNSLRSDCLKLQNLRNACRLHLVLLDCSCADKVAVVEREDDRAVRAGRAGGAGRARRMGRARPDHGGPPEPCVASTDAQNSACASNANGRNLRRLSNWEKIRMIALLATRASQNNEE